MNLAVASRYADRLDVLEQPEGVDVDSRLVPVHKLTVDYAVLPDLVLLDDTLQDGVVVGDHCCKLREVQLDQTGGYAGLPTS